jgi:hypothetical protein
MNTKTIYIFLINFFFWVFERAVLIYCYTSFSKNNISFQQLPQMLLITVFSFLFFADFENLSQRYT